MFELCCYDGLRLHDVELRSWGCRLLHLWGTASSTGEWSLRHRGHNRRRVEGMGARSAGISRDSHWTSEWEIDSRRTAPASTVNPSALRFSSRRLFLDFRFHQRADSKTTTH